jgi:hypothetical protein
MARLIPVTQQEEDLWMFIRDLAQAAGDRWADAVLLGGTMVRVHEVVAHTSAGGSPTMTQPPMTPRRALPRSARSAVGVP